jgi:hypothetical protein
LRRLLAALGPRRRLGSERDRGLVAATATATRACERRLTLLLTPCAPLCPRLPCHDYLVSRCSV